MSIEGEGSLNIYLYISVLYFIYICLMFIYYTSKPMISNVILIMYPIFISIYLCCVLYIINILKHCRFIYYKHICVICVIYYKHICVCIHKPDIGWLFIYIGYRICIGWLYIYTRYKSEKYTYRVIYSNMM